MANPGPGAGSRRAIRQLWSHLTRTQARAGWFIAVVCLAIYDAYPLQWWGGALIAESALILFSVALGAVFLPEISGRLWSVSAKDVRDLIPDAKVKGLQEALVSAQVDEPEFVSHLINSAIVPLLEAGKDGTSLFFNVNYSVDVHVGKVIRFRSADYKVNLVQARIGARRVLPPDEPYYWISVVRSAALLRGEFDQAGCLYREIVDIDPRLDEAAWRASVEEHTQARFVVGGSSEVGSAVPPGGLSPVPHPPGVFRWYFQAPDLPADGSRRRTVTVSLDHPHNEDRLPVVFGSYYVVGSTQVRVNVFAPDDTAVDFEYFLGKGLSAKEVVAVDVVKKSLGTEISATSSDDTLIWPGSGMAISWSAPAVIGSVPTAVPPASIPASATSGPAGATSSGTAQPLSTATVDVVPVVTPVAVP